MTCMWEKHIKKIKRKRKYTNQAKQIDPPKINAAIAVHAGENHNVRNVNQKRRWKNITVACKKKKPSIHPSTHHTSITKYYLCIHTCVPVGIDIQTLTNQGSISILSPSPSIYIHDISQVNRIFLFLSKPSYQCFLCSFNKSSYNN